MKNNITTLAAVACIATFSGNLLAMQPTSWLSAQDTRTALIAVGAAAGTWGALEAGKALVSHFRGDPIATVQKEVTELKKNALTPDAAMTIHQLLLSYGLVDQEGNFKETNHDIIAADFVMLTTRIETITKCPGYIEVVRAQIKALENRLATLEKAQRTPTTATLPNIPDDTPTETSQYVALSESALKEVLK